MQANYGYGNQVSVSNQKRQGSGRPMNLRPPPAANRRLQQNTNMYSNPFQRQSDFDTNNNAGGGGGGLFEQPTSPQQEQDNNDIFASDNPSHSGITFEEDSNDMFVADPTPTESPVRIDSNIRSNQFSQPPQPFTAQPPTVPSRPAPAPRRAVPPRRPPAQVPNANLFSQPQRQQTVPNQHLFGSAEPEPSEDQYQEHDLSQTESHANVQFEDVGLQQEDAMTQGSMPSGGRHRGREQPVFNSPFSQQQQPDQQPSKADQGFVDYDNEPPILEELGIQPDEIKKKFLAILTQRGFKEVCVYEDMAGALFVLFLFGTLLLLRGNYQFGNIYGAGTTGCVCIYGLVNLLTKKGVYLELYSTISILGYSLLPFCCLALGSLFLDLKNAVGIALCVAVIIWATVSATRFFENMMEMRDQRYLIAYPIFLFYCVFLLLVIF